MNYRYISPQGRGNTENTLSKRSQAEEDTQIGVICAVQIHQHCENVGMSQS